MNTTINNANTKYHNIIINDINEVQTIVFDNSSSINENEYIILQNKLKNIFEYLQSSKMIIDSQYEAMEKQHNSLLGVKVVLDEKQEILEHHYSIIKYLESESLQYKKTIDELNKTIIKLKTTI